MVSSVLRFSTPDGIQLVAEAWGNPAHAPVILLHGGGQTHHAWKNTARALADTGYYAIAADLRGHGASGWSPDGDYAIDRFVSDLRAIAAPLKQSPAVIGASLGGITALLAEGEGPSFLSALILVDVTPTVQHAGVEKIQEFMGANAQEGFASIEEAGEAVAAYLPHRPQPRSLAGLAKNLRLDADGRYRWHWDPALLSFNEKSMTPTISARLLAATDKLRLPVLLVRGGASELVSTTDAEDFIARVPGSRYVNIADARHMVAGDINDHFGAAVLEFLQSLESVPHSPPSGSHS